MRLTIAVLAALIVPGIARANDNIARAVEQAQEAEFEAALLLLDEAERDGPLTRDDLVTLYTQRALVRFALGNTDQAETDLARLAALEPNFVLPPTAPPPVRVSFERVRRQSAGRIEVQARAVRDGGSVRIRSEVTGGDGTQLVRAIAVHARSSDGEFERFEGTDVEVPTPSDRGLEYYVRVIGPGDAVIASHGSAETPERLGVRAEGVERSLGAARTGGLTAEELVVGLAIGGGLIAGIGIAVLVAVILAAPMDTTLVTGPRLRP